MREDILRNNYGNVARSDGNFIVSRPKLERKWEREWEEENSRRNEIARSI